MRIRDDVEFDRILSEAIVIDEVLTAEGSQEVWVLIVRSPTN